MMRPILISVMLLATNLAFAQIENFHNIAPGIDRSARPTAEDVNWLAETEYKSILNIEGGHFSSKPGYVKDEEKQAKALSLQFFHVSMHPMEGPSKDEVDAALEKLADPANHPILLHCKHGKDRTGIVAAAYRIKYQGWSYDQAVAEMDSYGFETVWFKSWLDVLKEYDSKNKYSLK